MNQETKRALGYGETEPTSKAKFRPLLDYGIAMLAGGLAVLLQFVLTPWFEGSPDSSPFLQFFAAVMVAAWFGGLGAGHLATVLSALLSNYFFLVPQYTIQSAIPTQSLRLAAFVLEGVLISALVGALHAARRRAEANALKVKLDEEELRVRARQQQAVAELGRRALAETDLKNPKVVLLDLKLPKVDGLEGLGRIKTDLDLKTIPVVMLTSSREERDLLRSYNLGTNAYVVKPINFTDFIKAVKEVGLFWGVINQSPGIVEWKT